MKCIFACAVVAAALLAGSPPAAPAPAPPAFGVVISFTPASPLVGQPVTFTATASGGTGGLVYQWVLSDRTSTGFLSQNIQLVHPFTAAAHISVRVNVEDTTGTRVFDTATLTVHNPLTADKPTASSTIILDAANNRVWCVNADQDTVSAINATTNALVFEKPVGKNPRTLAQAFDGTIWVVSQQHPSMTLLDPLTGALKHVIPLPHGSLPYGICMTPDGKSAFVSFQGIGGVAKYDTTSRALVASSTVPPSARGIAVSGDGRVFVSRFLSPQPSSLLAWNSNAFIAGNHGEVVELSSSLATVRTINLVMDPGFAGAADPDFGSDTPPSASRSRGVPNYLTSLVISPDGTRAWVPSKKDNVQRGTRTPERDGRLPSAETTYRAIVSSIDLGNTTKTVDQLSERFDVDNSEMPQAACISPLGDLIFIALQGNNRVQVRDLYDSTNLLNGPGENTGSSPTDPAALAPQGVVLDPVSRKLFVHNYMGRSISVFDASAVLSADGQVSSLGAPVVVPTIVGPELMGVQPARGKQVFYNASDPRMSRLGYISCAGCHLDGASDMRVLDFTNRGEGFRNTVVLQGRGGTGMGNVHWSANFNEIQDFDNDVFARFHDGPASFPPPVPPSFTGNPGSPNSPLSASNNAGRDPDLDAMAAYVGSLTKVSRSPFRNTDGTLTAQGAAGEAVFTAKNCQKCHKGRNFTDSTVGTVLAPPIREFAPLAGEIVLHNVGTLKPTSGGRLGGALPGIDTPTLKGVWQSAPYLHDGSAETLMDVLADATAVAHLGSVLTAQEKSDLVRYMLEIDELDAPPVDPLATAPTVTIDSVSTGKPYSTAPLTSNSLPWIDRSYRFNGTPASLPVFTLIRTAEDDKAVTTLNHLKITVAVASTVYVVYDNRATSLPDWVTADYPMIPVATQTFVGQSGVTFSFHGRSLAAGDSVTLGGNLATGAAGALRNYFVMVFQTAPVIAEGPLNKNEWAHDRDGDGDGLRDEFEAMSTLSPFTTDTPAAGTVPDEDTLGPSGKTFFEEQVVAETPAPAPADDGGGGGCGLIGAEPFLIAALAAMARRRRVRRFSGVE